MAEAEEHDVDVDLDLDGPWRIGEETFATIVEDMRELQPRSIVEFGSGASSVRLAQTFPDAHIFSLEHDPEYFRQTRALQKNFPDMANLDVDPRPLAWQRHHGSLYYSYGLGSFPNEIDAVIIDGPPRKYLGGREACFYQVYDHLRVGGRIYLDDCERDGELRAISNWLYRYREEMGECVRFIHGRHHLCIFEKRSHEAHPRKNLGLQIENRIQVARNVTRAIRRRLRDK